MFRVRYLVWRWSCSAAFFKFGAYLSGGPRSQPVPQCPGLVNGPDWLLYSCWGRRWAACKSLKQRVTLRWGFGVVTVRWWVRAGLVKPAFPISKYGTQSTSAYLSRMSFDWPISVTNHEPCPANSPSTEVQWSTEWNRGWFMKTKPDSLSGASKLCRQSRANARFISENCSIGRPWWRSCPGTPRRHWRSGSRVRRDGLTKSGSRFSRTWWIHYIYPQVVHQLNEVFLLTFFKFTVREQSSLCPLLSSRSEGFYSLTSKQRCIKVILLMQGLDCDHFRQDWQPP